MIDMNKKYRTRGGREARIYAIDGAFGEDGDPVHGAVLETDGWHMYTWGANGIYFCDGGQESEHDLIEVKPERWYPIGISEFGNYSLYSKPSSTKEAALAVVFDSAVDIRTIDAWKAPE